ncbi:MAG TPA: GNAT family N-acetyltransferase, partial [Burkholderiaceae bacterium]
EPYPNFARGWAQQCAEQGWLRLGVARIDDVPIAAQLWFVYGRRAYIFKLAYDESQSRWSAGTVLTAHMMRHVLEVDRVVEVDFLSGDDPYKKSWMMQRRERVGLIACNLRLLPGLIAAASEFVGQATARLRARP